MGERVKVVFVCLHGAAKSVVAAQLFRRLAAARGLRAEVLARGLEPDPQLSSAATAGLAAEGIDVGADRPCRLEPEDLVDASRVIALGCDVSRLVPPGVPVDDWSDVPPVSDEYQAARTAILAHFPRLVAACRGAMDPPTDG
jgi:arsenate reductase